MWKAILAGTTALAIAGTSLVYAQQRDQGAARWRGHGTELSQEDRAAFTDARIAALKAGLRLTPEQEKNWPAFETALRDMAKMHQEHRGGPRQDGPRAGDRTDRADAGSVERMRRHAEMMANAGTSLKRLADAQEPLYQSLDDGQKNRFQLLSRVLRRSHFAEMRGRGGRGVHGMHQGMHGDHHGMSGDRHHDRDDQRDRGLRGQRGGDREHQRGMMGGTGEQL